MENPAAILASPAMTMLLVVPLVFALAGLVKGVTGLGLPTVAVGLLSIVMTPMEAASLLIVPSLLTNVWQALAGFGLKSLMSRLWPLLLGIVAGVLAGGVMLPADDSGFAAAALGVALMLYAAIGLASVRMPVPRRLEPWLSPVVGIATGLVTAATGVFVIPVVPYLQGLNLGKEDLVQALGLAFTISTMALAANLALAGAFALDIADTFLHALVPALAGMLIGQWIRSRIRPEVFRKCFFTGLLLLGAHLVLRAVTG